jgi:hypothetical protein
VAHLPADFLAVFQNFEPVLTSTVWAYALSLLVGASADNPVATNQCRHCYRWKKRDELLSSLLKY